MYLSVTLTHFFYKFRALWANLTPCPTKQEAQLSQRDRATLRVIDDFAKSLKVTQDYW